LEAGGLIWGSAGTLCLSLAATFLAGFASSTEADLKHWMIGPFVKQDDVNPILGPNFDSQFFCPIRGKNVRWESRAILGGGVVVKDGRVYMVYNAEDSSEGFQRNKAISPGTMRMGVAESQDGLRFTRRAKPVLYPDRDFMQALEWPGGPQIPRLVEGPDRVYYLHYSPWDLRTSRIATAISKDLVRWTKHGNIFERTHEGKYKNLWAKSGAVVCRLESDRLIAARLNGRYWMYWGEGLYLAHSPDLINWTIVEDPKTNKPLQVLAPRPGKFDYQLIEGGLAVLTDKGIVVIYNSFQPWTGQSRNAFAGFGQALFSAQDPKTVLDRCDSPFLKADREHEVQGALPNVIFATGLAYFKGKWMLYYNGGDWMMNVAVSDSTSAMPRANAARFPLSQVRRPSRAM
jgi:predicted GH43/DUF377 family glycosyl hydrolase